MERLIIKNFGPIKDVDLTFRRFNVLIGEQATGKSTVAKLLCVCRYFSYLLDDQSTLHNPFHNGLIAWNISGYVQENTVILYECVDYHFQFNLFFVDDFDHETGEPDGRYPIYQTKLTAKSDDFKKLIEDLEKLQDYADGYDHRPASWVIPTNFFQNEVRRVMDYPFYVPTERGLQSIFSLGRSSIKNLSDSLFNQLAELDQIARQFNSETQIEPLDIIYKNTRGNGMVRKQSDTRFHDLDSSASGYQSIIPVVLAVKHYTDLRRKKKTFVIEEPELSLFPTAQNKLIQFLVDRTVNHGNSTLIATHSPYVLASLNNLMSLYLAGLKDKVGAEKIVPAQYWISHKDCTAYRMLPDGTCTDIFDRTEGLIRTEEIDEVSTLLNEQFDESLQIQFWKK